MGHPFLFLSSSQVLCLLWLHGELQVATSEYNSNFNKDYIFFSESWQVGFFFFLIFCTALNCNTGSILSVQKLYIYTKPFSFHDALRNQIYNTLSFPCLQGAMHFLNFCTECHTENHQATFCVKSAIFNYQQLSLRNFSFGLKTAYLSHRIFFMPYPIKLFRLMLVSCTTLPTNDRRYLSSQDFYMRIVRVKHPPHIFPIYRPSFIIHFSSVTTVDYFPRFPSMLRQIKAWQIMTRAWKFYSLIASISTKKWSLKLFILIPALSQL